MIHPISRRPFKRYIIIFLESIELAFLITSILFPEVFQRYFGGSNEDDEDPAGQYYPVQNQSE